MTVDLGALLIGLVALVWSADQFVLGSSRLAALFALPPIVIGAVVMGFGTSAPELIVSSIAAAGGDRDLGVGNIVGSNVANLTLVLGTAAWVARMAIPPGVFSREGPLAIGASLLFAVFVVEGSLSRLEGVILAATLVVVVVYLMRIGHAEPDLEDVEPQSSTPREVGRTSIGLVGTVTGAQFVVWGATDLADRTGVTGGFIGFSLVALGTSLPELVTTVACARRRETDLIVGNLFGSNIFNALAVGGGMGLVGAGAIGDEALTTWGLALMIATSVIAFGLASRGRFVDRGNGVVLLACYVASMAVLALTTDGDGGDRDDVPDDRAGTVVVVAPRLPAFDAADG